MITLDNQTKAIIIAVLVGLAAVPKPSLETIKGWLAKLKPAGTGTFSFKSLIIPAVSIFFLLSSETPPPTPGPDPVPVVEKDRLDKCSDDYRELLSEIWKDYVTAHPELKDDEARLSWLNNRQQAAYTAAFDAYIAEAKATATKPADAASLSQKLKERKF
jgi:hypothetical protein